MRASRFILLLLLLAATAAYAQVPPPPPPPPPPAPAPAPPPAPKPTADELKARIKDSREGIARTRARIEQRSKASGVPADKSKAFDIFIDTNLDTATPAERARALEAYRIWEDFVSLKSQEAALEKFEQQLEETDDILDEIEDSRGKPDRVTPNPPTQTRQTPYKYTPMAAPWADVTPALGAMGIVNWLREDPGPLSAFQVKLVADFIRMYGEAYGLPTDPTTLALQSAAASAFPSTDPAQIEHARHASILHGIVTLFEARSGTTVAGRETPSQTQMVSPFDWGTVRPGGTYVRSIAISNGCSSVKVVAISHAVPHLSAPASVSVAPGGTTIDFSLSVPPDAQGTLSGTITLTYAGDDTCKPRTADFPVTARIGG